MADDDTSGMGDVRALVDDDENSILHSLGPHSKKRLIAIVEARSREQAKVSLGTYNDLKPPPGFVVSHVPAVEPETAIVSKVIRLQRPKSVQYELKLVVTNFSDTTVSVEASKIV